MIHIYQYNCIVDGCQPWLLNTDDLMKMNNWKEAGKEKPVMWFYILACAAIVD